MATPRSRLSAIRAQRAADSSALRERIMEAMLATCGALGYRNATIKDVLERYGGNRTQFYQHFDNKAGCYAAAYEVEIERLAERLLNMHGPRSSWRPALRRALSELARFACERPDLARGLLVEARVAGEPVLEKRAEVLERLSRAIDGARRETGSRHSPPPVTALFMVSAIEGAVGSALVQGEPRAFEHAVPELVHLLVAPFFGEAEAERELTAALAARESARVGS